MLLSAYIMLLVALTAYAVYTSWGTAQWALIINATAGFIVTLGLVTFLLLFVVEPL